MKRGDLVSGLADLGLSVRSKLAELGFAARLFVKLFALTPSTLLRFGLVRDQIFFLGNYSPESAGDYASGTNHTLPTNGFARSYSGVNLDSFTKKITLQSISKAGLRQLGNTIIDMAEAESLQAHANAVKLRLK